MVYLSKYEKTKESKVIMLVFQAYRLREINPA
jgi:hypothetical protein